MLQTLALWESLERTQDDYRLYVFCGPEFEKYRSYPRLDTIPFWAVLPDDVIATRENRPGAEFFWGTKAAIIRHCLLVFGLADVVYIDTDFWFFDNLSPDSISGDADIAITPHRFPPELEWRQEKNGAYNAGLIWMANTPNVMRCLTEWEQQCIEWCSLKWESPERKCVDQGYLDAWPTAYGAHSVLHPGINLAPWNQGQYSYEDNKVDGKPVVAYHFHEFRRTAPHQYSRGGYQLSRWVKDNIYKPYQKELERLSKRFGI